MLFAIRPGANVQGLGEKTNNPDVEGQGDRQLLDVPGKRDLRFLYDMLYNDNKHRAVNRPGTLGVSVLKVSVVILHSLQMGIVFARVVLHASSCRTWEDIRITHFCSADLDEH